MPMGSDAESKSDRLSRLTEQPVGLAVLFLTELWERFSFYGMGSLLVLYLNSGPLTGSRLQNLYGSSAVVWLYGAPRDADGVQALSSQLWGAYVFLAYVTPILGGTLADAVFGSRTTLLCGGALMALGHGCMVLERWFFIGLALVALGNGGFKPSVSAQVSDLYPENSPLRERGFAIFYAGINVGAFLAPLACGHLAETVSYHAAFGLAGVGMILALFIYLIGLRFLPPSKAEARGCGRMNSSGGRGYESQGEMPISASVAFASSHMTIAQWASLSALCAFTIPFWAVYAQLGNTLVLVLRDHTERSLGGGRLEIPVSWLQALNPCLCILILQPLSSFWARQSSRGTAPSPTTKMGIGCALLATAYVGIGVVAATYGSGAAPAPAGSAAAASRGRSLRGGGSLRGTSVDPFVQGVPSWRMPLLPVLMAITLMTVGEIYVSPVGLALVCSTSGGSSAALGVWFVSGGMGGALAGYLGAFYSHVPIHRFLMGLGIVSALASACFLFAGPILQEHAAGGRALRVQVHAAAVDEETVVLVESGYLGHETVESHCR